MLSCWNEFIIPPNYFPYLSPKNSLDTPHACMRHPINLGTPYFDKLNGDKWHRIANYKVITLTAFTRHLIKYKIQHLMLPRYHPSENVLENAIENNYKFLYLHRDVIFVSETPCSASCWDVSTLTMNSVKFICNSRFRLLLFDW